MNVTLVYPCIRNYGGFNTLGKTFESCFINHGLPQLTACLEQNGHEVVCLDLREAKSWKDVESWIAQSQAKIFGIHMPTLDYHEAVQTAKLIRDRKPHATIIVGGPHPSIMPLQVSEEKVFDYIFEGEAEITLPKLIDNPEHYSRIVTGEHPNLNELPYEKREIFNLKKIFNTKSPFTGKPFIPMPFINVISGRGCPYQCGFCKPGEDYIFGKFRMRSLEHFTGEIQTLHDKYHFQTLMIDDDAFTLNKDYVLKFCDWTEKHIGKPWMCQSRADFITNNPDILKRMRQAGLDTVFVGFESGTQRMLDLMKKGTTVEQNYNAAEILHTLGIKIWANYMIGLPTETKEEMQETLTMINRIKPEKPSPAFFTPTPGTNLYDYCKQNNLLASEDIAELGRRNPDKPKIKGHDYKWMTKKVYPKSSWAKRTAKTILHKLKVI